MASKTFEDALTFVMGWEVGPHFKLDDACRAGMIDTRENRKKCGYVNDPDDSGGVTKYGIAQNAHPEIDVKTMTWPDAMRIYERNYWVASGADRIQDRRIAVAHFDAAVNLGTKQAGKLLQRTVGVDDDGVVGPQTLAMVDVSNADQTLFGLIARRRQLYYTIVDRKPTQAKFLSGWLNRLSALETLVKGMK